MSKQCQVSFCGLNSATVLCKLSQFGVTDFHKSGRNCSIRIKTVHLNAALDLLKESGFTDISVRYVGISAVTDFFSKHWLLPIAFVLAVALCAVLPMFCLKIDVGGDLPAEQVQAALSDCGVTVGKKIVGLDLDTLENALCLKLGAMYVTVNRSGCRLFVNAYKKKLPQDVIDLKSHRDMVASAEGEVVSVLCEQGNPLVKVGNVVSVGDVLIEGKRIFADGTFSPVYACGRVKLKVSKSGFAPFCGYVTQTELTGKTQRVTYVKLFGKTYAKAASFATYTEQSSCVKLSPLCLEVGTLTYAETVQKQIPCTVYEVLTDLQSAALSAALKGCDFSPVQTTYSVSPSGVTATVFGYVYCY